MRFLALAFLALAATASAGTKIFRFQMATYPKSAAGCHAAAKDVGSRFAVATSQGIRLARCLSEDAEGYRILVEYESETPVPLVTTTAGNGLYPAGQYKTRAACEAEIPALSQIFETETKLLPTFAYCERDEFSVSYPWYVRLDAFGTAARRPRVGGYFIFGLPLNYAAGAYGAELIAALAQAGVRVTHVRSHSGGAHAALSVTYYSERRLDFDPKELTQHFDKQQCLSQLAEAKAELAQFSVRPLMVYCGVDFLSTVELTAIYSEGPDLRVTSSAETFPSFADCRAGKAALITKYQTELKLPVLGGVCANGRRGFVLRLFEKH
jgi:hypothetical protein